MRAISYRDLDLKMPPTGKLSDEQVADFKAWIAMGAADPRTEEVASPARKKDTIDFAKARQFWAFRPIEDPPLPEVRRQDWAASPIDRFLLAKLEENGLHPAPPTEKRIWIRRVTFDLIGLPPTPDEIDDFLADESPRAAERVVERLLASPHYGERWGRHWLDLVRFAETNGHEFDNEKLDAWRYRDYVIRAFNQDVPYDRFVKEHIAGDLLPDGRLTPDASLRDSPLGTGFYWLWEVLNSATDSVKSRADEVDNQLDVLGKAFLGLTVACARCHDHKFDPIPTADYYSLAGILHSTDISESCIDSPSQRKEIEMARRRIAESNQEIEESLRPTLDLQARQLSGYLAASADVLAHGGEGKGAAAIAESAAKHGLQAEQVKAWVRYVEAARQAPHAFYPFAVLASGSADSPLGFSARLQAVRQQLAEARRMADRADQAYQERGDIVFESFERSAFDGWVSSGQAFGEGPLRSATPNQRLAGYRGQGVANSFGEGSDVLVGTLTSKKFTYPGDKLYTHVLMAGTAENASLGEKAQLRITLVADGHKSLHLTPDGSGRMQWQSMQAVKERKRACYFEIVDRSRGGHIVVDKIVFSDSKEPPPVAIAPEARIVALLDSPALGSLEDLAGAYQRLFVDVAEKAEDDPDARTFLAALSPTGRMEDLGGLLPAPSRERLESQQAQRAALETGLPPSSFGIVAVDHDPRNVRIHARGNHKNLGPEVPRQFLQVIAGENQEPFHEGSGRRQLAEWMVSSRNPLTARVMVNRLWAHHFGKGIARTVDNFGETGERPTHPELLDFLASRFIDSGWSVKAMHRLMVLSSAYGMSSRGSEEAARTDPENKLLSHMPARRLEAEAIRDSVLAVAGTLNPEVYGPSVPPHISEYQDGRGRPQSGPLDGNRRRSVYVQVRRNFLTPLFLAFDYPLPISAIGQRSVSAVPSQALILLNNEFVNEQAAKWAQRELETQAERRRRIDDMFLRAFGRLPEEREIGDVLAFLEEQKARYGDAREDDPRLWTDLAHVLINTTEFIYVR